LSFATPKHLNAAGASGVTYSFPFSASFHPFAFFFDWFFDFSSTRSISLLILLYFSTDKLEIFSTPRYSDKISNTSSDAAALIHFIAFFFQNCFCYFNSSSDKPSESKPNLMPFVRHQSFGFGLRSFNCFSMRNSKTSAFSIPSSCAITSSHS
jgi:hypothetical protein